MNTLRIAAAAAALLLVPVAASASTGTPITGLPFTAPAPGTYYLTGNLTGSAGQSGILIDSSDVTIDLCGFRLEGVPGSKSGITHTDASMRRSRIRNGTVARWGETGVALSTDSRLERVAVVECEQWGAVMGAKALVEHCNFERNVEGQLRVDMLSNVRDCMVTSVSSAPRAVELGNTSVATRVTVTSAEIGIFAFADSRIESCRVRSFLETGIEVTVGGAVIDCTAVPGTAGSGIVGIRVGDASVVSGCQVREGHGTGILAGSHCRVERSILHEGQRGIVAGDGARISDCVVAKHSELGVQVAAACTIERTTSTDNGEYGYLTGRTASIRDSRAWDVDYGFHVGPHSTLLGNQADESTTAGYFAGSDGSSFRHNVAVGGARGFWVTGEKNLVIENRAIDTGGDFTIPVGNPFGPTLNNSWVIQGSKPQANFRTPN